MAINYGDLEKILSNVEKIEVNKLGELNKKIEEFSKYRKEQDTRMLKLEVDYSKWQDGLRQEIKKDNDDHKTLVKEDLTSMRGDINKIDKDSIKWRGNFEKQQNTRMSEFEANYNDWKDGLKQEIKKDSNAHKALVKEDLKEMMGDINKVKKDNEKWKQDFGKEQDARILEFEANYNRWTISMENNIKKINNRIDFNVNKLVQLEKRQKILEIMFFSSFIAALLLVIAFIIIFYNANIIKIGDMFF